MAVTTARPTPANPIEGMSRDEVAELVLPLLSDTPISGRAIGRQLGVPEGKGKMRAENVYSALAVLEARGQARKRSRYEWVLTDSAVPNRESATVTPISVKFPYRYGILKTADMMIDKGYQRPLSEGLAAEIGRDFNPLLFGTLVISDRGADHQPQRYVLVDGQTRWTGARRAGVREVPAIVFTGLSFKDEAGIFELLQRKRRGMMSWHRFRAALAAENPEALAIRDIVEAAGYRLGDNNTTSLTCVAALESCYRTDPFVLERSLFILRASCGDKIPQEQHVRGVHFWLRDPGHKFRSKDVSADDEKLVRVIQLAGLDKLTRSALAQRQLALEAGEAAGHSKAVYVAKAIDALYRNKK